MDVIKYKAKKRRVNTYQGGRFSKELFSVDPVLIKFLDLCENVTVTQDTFFSILFTEFNRKNLRQGNRIVFNKIAAYTFGVKVGYAIEFKNYFSFSLSVLKGEFEGDPFYVAHKKKLDRVNNELLWKLPTGNFIGGTLYLSHKNIHNELLWKPPTGSFMGGPLYLSHKKNWESVHNSLLFDPPNGNFKGGSLYLEAESRFYATNKDK